jgi:zinc protease
MIETSKKILKNGLTVVHHFDETSPFVVVNTLYKIGAKDEDPERTGFAHLFEHLNV